MDILYFGYPYWGSPYYYGYPYGRYGYPVGAYYSYDPRGIYQGRVVNPGQPTNEGGGKDFSMAARVQRELATAGYYRGAIDGIVGDGTRRAIRNYERDNGLPVDGRDRPPVAGHDGPRVKRRLLSVRPTPREQCRRCREAGSLGGKGSQRATISVTDWG